MARKKVAAPPKPKLTPQQVVQSFLDSKAYSLQSYAEDYPEEYGERLQDIDNAFTTASHNVYDVLNMDGFAAVQEEMVELFLYDAEPGELEAARALTEKQFRDAWFKAEAPAE